MPRNSARHFRLRLLISGIVGGVLLAAIVILSLNVARDLRLLNSASSDNVQWTLSQTEVEFLEFDSLLTLALTQEAPDLSELRREFDIFYSRISTLSQATIYADLRELPEFSRNLRIVETFLDRSVPLIDAPDAELIDGLAALKERTAEVRPNVRRLSNSSLNFFAELSDERRGAVAVTLSRLAAGVVVLMVALLMLAIYLGMLNAQNLRRRREATEAARRMNMITSTALDAVIVANEAGRIITFNAAAEQIFGYRTDEAVGADLGELIVPDHHRAAHEAGMVRLRAKGERRVVGKGRVTLEARRKNGEVFPVELAIQSAETSGGEIFVAFLRDISHRVAAEAELVSARDRALAGEKAKTDFLATMSHEIRTPLNGLLGNLTLLGDTPLSDRQARYIANMETSGRLLMSHITDVLDITRYDAGRMQPHLAPVNFGLLMQDIIDNQSGAAAAHSTTLTWVWHGEPADWVRSDRDMIQHILMNIIGNAVKFTRAGRVRVETARIDGTDGTELQIDVRDTGIGMSADLQTRVFEDFTTGNSAYDREVGGTGLGLGIARRCVRALGGSIELTSTEGEGSHFRVRLPVEIIAPPQAATDAGQPAPATRKCRVLLVEDNEINRIVAREMLLAAGHDVEEATDGRAAVALTEANRFDLILMDISMPVMDGRTATRAIRAGTGPSRVAPIVALTASAMAKERAAFIEDGMNAILTKPLSRDRLLALLEEVCKAREPDTPDADQTPQDVIDTPQFEDLRDTIGVKPLRGLLDRYAADLDGALALLVQAEAARSEDIAQLSHKLAGSAAMLGLAALRNDLLALERAAKGGDAEGMIAVAKQLPDTWRATQAALDVIFFRSG